VVAAAALAALDVIDRPDLLAGVQRLGARLAAGLRELPGVREVRARGLMQAIELDHAPGIARRALLEQRLIVNATGPTTVRLEPPLVVGEAEIDEALRRLERLLG
jgi:acetylornithine/N-succinyldiaminopimelate aminotransferase